MQSGPGAYTAAEETVRGILRWVELGVETAGALVIAIGVLLAAWHFARHATGGQRGGYVRIRLVLAHYLALALELLLAADILATAISPTWDQIGKLAAIAAIRTALNYFLTKEMEGERKSQETDSADAPPPP